MSPQLHRVHHRLTLAAATWAEWAGAGHGRVLVDKATVVMVRQGTRGDQGTVLAGKLTLSLAGLKKNS